MTSIKGKTVFFPLTRSPGMVEHFLRIDSERNSSAGVISGKIRGDCAPGLFFCDMFSVAQGAHRGRPVAAAPCTPGLRPDNIAAMRFLRLIPSGFGSGRGSVPASHGPQPASMRAAPACRERLSDVEAANTGCFSEV